MLGCEITRVEADVTSWADTPVYLYVYDEQGEIVGEATSVSVAEPETMEVEVPPGVTVVAASLNHCEGFMRELRFF